jgi:hypothetical protein
MFFLFDPIRAAFPGPPLFPFARAGATLKATMFDRETVRAGLRHEASGENSITDLTYIDWLENQVVDARGRQQAGEDAGPESRQAAPRE